MRPTINARTRSAMILAVLALTFTAQRADAQPAHAEHGERTEPAQHATAPVHEAPASAHSATALALPPITAAGRAAAFPDLGDTHLPHSMLEDPFNRLVLLDRLEARDADGGDVLGWDLSAWAGRSLNRLWLRSEGERHSGSTERAELQALWGRSVAPWWDFVAGLRQDFRPGADQTWAAIGVQGLAPYRFEIEATAFLGEGGQAAARFEVEYELLMTQRLILEPSIELDWHARDDTARGIGAGLSSAEIGLRLRYEIRREVAPYVGVVRERTFGGTADIVRANGGAPSDTQLVAGIRLWF